MRCSRALVICIPLVIALMTSEEAYAQHQYDKWYFGFKQGLDFSTSPPTVLKDGETNTIEGSAVYCDPKTGSLLFYTDGVIVWDRLHRQMPSGKDLIADQSSTQAALIVPDPAEADRYYLFHSDQSGYARPSKGLYYSVIDMRLNGGYGDVSIKNQKLLHESTEKLTAVSLCGGEAYWVIGHELMTNTFVAWLVDLNGVSTVPVRTSIGVAHGPTPVAGAGYLAASPDGLYLASVIQKPTPSIEVFKFDLASGRLYERIELPAISQPYGVSFSPDGRKLYVGGDKQLAQFDLAVWDSSEAAKSRFTFEYTGRSEGALKLGPDRKIYVQESDSLGVISFPDALGRGCGYEPAMYPLVPSGQFGLPNNIDALGGNECRAPIARIGRHESNVCEGASISFKDSSRFAPTSWLWHFEGGSPSISADRNPKNIYYAKAGAFNVTLIAFNASGSDTAHSVVRVKSCPVPSVSLLDTTICILESVMFKDTSGTATSWQWTFEGGQPDNHAGRTPPPIFYYRAGRHKVTLVASNQYGFTTESSYVTVETCELPVAALKHDANACAGSTLTFTDRSRNVVTKREWTFQGGMPSVSTERDPENIFYQLPGIYTVRLIAINSKGADTAYSTVTIEKCEAPTAVLSDRSICQGECIWLEDSSKGTPTYWHWSISGGSVTTSSTRAPGNICFDSAGTFEVRLVVGNEYGADTIVSHITVASAAPRYSTDLMLGRPIVSCVAFDTAIWIEAGCSDIVLESVSSESPLRFGIESATIAANTRLAIPITILESSPRQIQTSIALRLDGKSIAIPCTYVVANAPEAFSYTFDSEPFVAEHCSSVTRRLIIENQACTRQEIREVRIKTKDGQPTPFIAEVMNDHSILPNEQASIDIRYDPTLPGPTDAEMVITSAAGTETIFQLRGLRKELPATGIGLAQSVTEELLAGDDIEFAVLFESGVDVAIAPEEVEVTIGFNTDVLSMSHVEASNGWTLKETEQLPTGLKLVLLRQRSTIVEGEELAKLRFTSYIAAEDSTSVTIIDAICDPADPDFSSCKLQTNIGARGSVSVAAGCGVAELRRALRNAAAARIAVHPNPIRSQTRALTMHVYSLASASFPKMMSLEIVGVEGKTVMTIDPIMLSAREQEITLPLDPLAAGSYALRATIGTDVITTHIAVVK